MSTGDTVVAIIGGLMMLALNYRAFLADSSAANHDGKAKLRMAAIWVTIFFAVFVIFRVVAA